MLKLNWTELVGTRGKRAKIEKNDGDDDDEHEDEDGEQATFVAIK